MSSPKHLWSGDWQDESDALARELARRRATMPASDRSSLAEQRPGPERPPAPKQRPMPAQKERLARIPPSVTAIPRPRRQWRQRWPLRSISLRRPRIAKPPWLRAALLAAVGLLVVAGGAYGLTRALGSGGSQKASASAGTPWLGVELESLPINRVVITAVVPGGPADASGLGPGDVITSVNNRPIEMPGDVTAAVAGMHPGDRVQVQIQRGGLPLAAQVKLAARPPGYP